MKKLESKLFKKFKNDKLKELSKCKGGNYVPTYVKGDGGDRYHPNTNDTTY